MEAQLSLPRIIGHRGVAGHAPENTLASIREAAAMGLMWVEFDVMMTKDGELVLIHDESLDRTTDGDGWVPKTSLAELKERDAGGWFDKRFQSERIPTLKETTKLLAELGIAANIEIKPAKGYVKETSKALGEFLKTEWPPELVAPIISSFQAEALEEISKVAPDVPRGFLVRRVPSNWSEMLDRLDCAFIHCSQRHLLQSQAATILDSGHHVLCYTVNNRNRAEELWGWGVSAVFSDYPDRLGDI